MRKYINNKEAVSLLFNFVLGVRGVGTPCYITKLKVEKFYSRLFFRIHFLPLGVAQ